jgi:lipoprotein-anchoring transpeptidase ErfK/SrfK
MRALVIASTALMMTVTLTAQRPPAVKAGNPRGTSRQAQHQAMQEMLAVQVALDRAGFSTGVIDGKAGTNTKRATDAYRNQHGADPAPSADPLVSYQITEQDASGPFVPSLPSDLMQQSELTALSYRAVDELLAERFHTTPQVLRTLNPESTMKAGEIIMVPNVEPFALPSTDMSLRPPSAKSNAKNGARAVGTSGRNTAASPDPQQAATITVSRSASSLTVAGPDGRVMFFAPVTTGSEHDPLPLGEWKVTGVFYNPPFRYNPDLFWDADPSHSKATIPPGPNGPVGVVWMDLTKEHYGIHGSPEPSQIGRTQSHGCVRLTNWDAVRAASLITIGTPVRFVE